MDASTPLTASAQSAGALYNSEADYVDSSGTTHQLPLELLNPDKGIGIQTSLKVPVGNIGAALSTSTTGTTTTGTTTTGTTAVGTTFGGGHDRHDQQPAQRRQRRTINSRSMSTARRISFSSTMAPPLRARSC